jgi:thiamine-phosphate pyrophosphorylase
VTVDSETARALIAFVQKKGIAALVVPASGEIQKLGGDGFHLPWSADVVHEFKAVRQASPRAIVGADAGRSRHDAMEIGEAGADYVAFGIPLHVEDREKAAQRQLNLIGWWSELFEVPCVAFDVPDSEAARRLADAGADFVGVRISSAELEKDAVARIGEYSQALRIPEPVK